MDVKTWAQIRQAGYEWQALILLDSGQLSDGGEFNDNDTVGADVSDPRIARSSCAFVVWGRPESLQELAIPSLIHCY